MEAIIRKEELYYMSETGKRIYTIEDIEALPEGQRAELLDGEMYMMACPTTTHQLLLIWLNSEIFRKIREKGGLCKAIPAPFVYHFEDKVRVGIFEGVVIDFSQMKNYYYES